MLNPDFKDMLCALSEAAADYLVVGAEWAFPVDRNDLSEAALSRSLHSQIVRRQVSQPGAGR